MLDFNPHRKCEENIEPEDTDLIIQHFHRDNPTHVPSGGTFKDPKGIITNLPYHSIARKVGSEYSAFMIDDERILAIEVSLYFAISFLPSNSDFLKAHRMGYEHSLESLEVLLF